MSQVSIEVVVNGSGVQVKANPNAPLKTVIPEALRLSGNQGQPPKNWEIRDAAGTDLDEDTKLEDYLRVNPALRLFLNLRAGING